MPKIRIKNFGPIKGGFKGEDGSDWIDIKKVTVLIGDQGSGKSTVAKAISTLLWLEKAMHRRSAFITQSRPSGLKSVFDYQGIEGYFKDDTIIEYQGDAYHYNYSNDYSEAVYKEVDDPEYMIPKIMYVPAERNFLSTIKDAFDVRNIPAPLFSFAEELRRAQYDLNGEETDLPITNARYRFDVRDEQSYVIGKDYEVNLLNASSGFQSTIPLYLVSKSLSRLENNHSAFAPDDITINQRFRMNREIATIKTDVELSDEEKEQKIDLIKARFQNTAFINIVEEPEQNLFPTSQWDILQTLLTYNNDREGNKLIMTTHSPYLINYLSIAIQADHLKKKLQSSSKANQLLVRLSEIIPLFATVPATDVAIYQLDERDGSIRLLPTYEGIPSDKNYLNLSLQHGNEMFDALLEIEEEA